MSWGLTLLSVLLFAHQFTHPKTLRLGVRPDRLVLQIQYDVSPGRDARRTRALFDRDSDGALDAGERARLVSYFEDLCRTWLRVELNGAPVAWKRRGASPHRLDRPVEDDTTLGVALLYEAAIPAGEPIHLLVRDRTRDRDRHVPLVVDLAPGLRVRWASQGELHPGAGRIRRVSLSEGRPLELRLSRRAP